MSGNQDITENVLRGDPPWEELIDGETVLVYPNPGVNHYIISGNIQHILREYLEKKGNETI